MAIARRIAVQNVLSARPTWVGIACTRRQSPDGYRENPGARTVKGRIVLSTIIGFGVISSAC
jgi:hypothetical protein